MPTTFIGLVIFIAFLTPGFLYTSQRRTLAPQGERSALMETTSVVCISLATNVIVVGCFGLLRWAMPGHTPDVGLLLEDGETYWFDNLPYLLAWAVLLLCISSLLAVSAARLKVPRRYLNRVLAPTIIDSSAWCEAFAAAEGIYPHAGIDLADGSYIGGRVVWFSTHLEESGDRDLVLGPPLSLQSNGEPYDIDAERVIISARSIRRIDVSYIEDHPSDVDQ